jgi:hypothetical protein
MEMEKMKIAPEATMKQQSRIIIIKLIICIIIAVLMCVPTILADICQGEIKHMSICYRYESGKWQFTTYGDADKWKEVTAESIKSRPTITILHKAILNQLAKANKGDNAGSEGAKSIQKEWENINNIIQIDSNGEKTEVQKENLEEAVKKEQDAGASESAKSGAMVGSQVTPPEEKPKPKPIFSSKNNHGDVVNFFLQSDGKWAYSVETEDQTEDQTDIDLDDNKIKEIEGTQMVKGKNGVVVFKTESGWVSYGKGGINFDNSGRHMTINVNEEETELLIVGDKLVSQKDGKNRILDEDGNLVETDKGSFWESCKGADDCISGVCGIGGMCSDEKSEKTRVKYWNNINNIINKLSAGAAFGQELSSLLGLDFSEWEEMISNFFEESVMGQMLGAQEELICGKPSFNVDPDSEVVVEVNGQVYYGLYITCERSQPIKFYNETTESTEYYYMWNYRVMNVNEDDNYYNIMFRGNGISKNYYNKWQNLSAGGSATYVDSYAMADNSSNYYDEICVKLKYEIEDASGNMRKQVCNTCSEPDYKNVEAPYYQPETTNSTGGSGGSGSTSKEEDPVNSNW